LNFTYYQLLLVHTTRTEGKDILYFRQSPARSRVHDCIEAGSRATPGAKPRAYRAYLLCAWRRESFSM